MKYIYKTLLIAIITIFMTGCDIFGADETKVTIDYNCDGVSEYKCNTIDNKLNCMLIMPECKGYSFVGWYDAKTSGNEVNIDADFTKSTTIYAIWEEDGSLKSTNNDKTTKPENKLPKNNKTQTNTPKIKTYNITFNINGGSGKNPSKVSIKVDEMMPKIDKDIPTRSGYTFMGWYDNKDYTLGEAFYNELNEPSKYYDRKRDTILYAGWKKNSEQVVQKQQVIETYIISFDSNGGSSNIPASVNVKKGQMVPKINRAIPARSGYTFKGWYDNKDYTKGKSYYNELNEPVIYFEKNNDLKLYAGWSKNIVILSYKIMFNAYGGSGGQVDSVYLKEGDSLPKITSTQPTRKGYTFMGWYDSASGGTMYYSSTGIAQIKFNKKTDVTLYARWSANTYNVTFDKNGGTGNVPNSVIARYNQKMPTINKNIPTRSGYTFLGWYDNADYSKGKIYYSSKNESVTKMNYNSSLTLYAGWSKVNQSEYVITFNANGGSGGQTQSVKVKNGSAMPSISTNKPLKNGYIFNGWYDALNNGTMYYTAECKSARNYDKKNGTTLYAHYTPITYKISYSLNGGTKGSSSPNDAKYGNAVKIDNPTKTFTVTIDKNNSDATISKTSVSSKQEFIGWTSDANLDTSNAKYGKKDNVVNNWTTSSTKIKDEYFMNLMSTSGTIILNANWNPVNITLPKAEKSGYTCGYSTTSSGAIAYNSSGTYKPSITSTSAKLYVICTKNTYVVAFDANGGSGGQSTQVNTIYGEEMPAISQTKPKRDGYTFQGWYDEKTGGTQYYTENLKSARNYNKTKGIILYAHWKANGTNIKVASFNVAYFHCGGASAYNANCANEYRNKEISNFIVNTISNENISLIGFQEARDPYNQACKNNGGYCYYNRVRCIYEFNILPNILKRLGVNMDNETERNKHFVHTCPANVDAIYSKNAVDTSKTKTYNLTGSRTVEKVVVTINGINISFYNTHLGLDDLNEKNWKELTNIVKDDENPVIITGDFNYRPIARYSTYLQPLGFIIAAHDDVKENMNNNPHYMDSIFVRPYGADKVNHISVVSGSSRTIVTFKKYSDHNLIITELTIY